ncbi:DUF4258 domain-containing protein [Stenotrophomonas maltophilia]|uniref:DUF4258 domain-containing protein n=1 Tax=Stenotrophomonas maltophilia TaxID=40324 RepID=UPI000C14A598|nr:DUF4258 domain-containing protein [Stenotrophomonas maltophilia]MBH1379500.1 DUF4258 domain-containing protein [Stenotrophomonas maltophilia]MBH1395905.1 DUF4258 domain-containing protein [Stenotrophomonas maltophilia]MBH1472029.1 DUF4258 domain-containing protein [Stenotrophomonas maltophilia]MDZ5787082.1 DUF4258 domain-containing protein [Stenotrophomonas maltophilia]HDS1096358.1 DUF4258 domain-containing protein [Stenotrophomonas maltophilia]
MNTTLHFSQRMSQREVSREMVRLVREYGVLEGEKVVLGQRAAGQVIDELMDKLRVLKKIQDKGGVIVVEDGDSLITTYSYSRRRKRTGARRS